MKHIADKIFRYYEENIFERERTDISREEELVFSFADWVEDENNFRDIVELSDGFCDYKDIDDVEHAYNELVNFMMKGVDKWLGNPVENLIKDLKGAE